MLEDSVDDALLMSFELRRGGVSFQSRRVDTREQFLKALDTQPPDVILSDHGLPSFDGFSALTIAREKLPDVPFIFVTGSLGEETAVLALKSGATDYVLKHNLAKLAAAVHRAICQAEERAKRREAEAALRRSEERFRLLLESVKDYAICMLDPAGRIITWSAGVEDIEGYRPDEIIGKHFSCFFSAEDIASGQPDLELHTAATQGRFESQGWRLRKDGSRYWAHVVLTALLDEEGKLYGYSKILRDLTQQKQDEEQILRWNAELEQRVTQRTSQLEAANKELEAFSYSVSHDLRAPLRHIEGFIDMLQISAGSSLSQECREFVKTICGSARRMNDLIDHLLEFSRMGRVEMFQNPVDMAVLAEAVRIELSRGLENRKIVWSIGPLPTIQGDPVTIRQVLLNLISNALKYTRPRDEARIEIGAEDTALETVFFVRDNGVGFDPHHAERLFRVFQRLHTVGEFEGTGIGLAIVQLIIARHGGRTWAKACDGGGAAFYFTIPKSPVLSPPPDAD